ncbi:M48 family metalloprotease [Halorussus amylolyticus]|uniref:hypothetical protein n=1 Tax=Halorussus amylolyticus TaxID=1126242 RepID=UPI001046E24B|nr:hypothetical protein [Halorussus amylolyticus]
MNVLTAAQSLLAVVAVSVLSFASFRLHAWRAAKAPPKRAMSRIRRALGVGLPLTAIVAIFALLLADALGLTDAALETVSPALADSAIGAMLVWMPTLVGAILTVIAGYLGAFPYICEIREVDVSARDAAVRFGRVLAVSAGLFAVTVGAFLSLLGGALTSALSIVGFVAAIAALTLVFQPKLVAVSRTTRELTDAERERLDRLTERAGLSARATTVVEMGGDRTATVMLAGLPGRRHLFVTDYLLDEFDDDAVASVLASKTGRAKRYYREYKLAVVLAALGLVVGTLSGDIGTLADLSTPEFLAVFSGVMVALAWFGKRLLLSADEYAVERVGAGTFAETLEALADEHQVSYDTGRVRNLVLMAPSLGSRLDRIRSQSGD